MPKIAWENVESSNVSAVYFHEPTQTLCIWFNNGGLYSYLGVSHEIYMNLRMAPSVGKYLANVIKLRGYPYQRWSIEDDLKDYLFTNAKTG